MLDTLDNVGLLILCRRSRWRVGHVWQRGGMGSACTGIGTENVAGVEVLADTDTLTGIKVPTKTALYANTHIIVNLYTVSFVPIPLDIMLLLGRKFHEMHSLP
jgi:hypothetical protein